MMITMPNAKLTGYQVAGCRVRAALGEPVADLAAEYRIGSEAMLEAVTGRTWTAVPVPPCPAPVR